MDGAGPFLSREREEDVSSARAHRNTKAGHRWRFEGRGVSNAVFVYRRRATRARGTAVVVAQSPSAMSVGYSQGASMPLVQITLEIHSRPCPRLKCTRACCILERTVVVQILCVVSRKKI